MVGKLSINETLFQDNMLSLPSPGMDVGPGHNNPVPVFPDSG